MQDYLGSRPPDDARGCLQDIHWSGGAIGYFPTYTLGNLYAAQLFDHASMELGDMNQSFTEGDFTPLLVWLRQNVHRHGRRYQPTDLIRRVTGQPLSAEPLLRHLRCNAGVIRRGELNYCRSKYWRTISRYAGGISPVSRT